MSLPRGKLGGGEAGVVVVDGGEDGVVVGRKGLDENAAPFFAAAGAAGDLSNQLKCPLGGSQVAKMECCVGVDDADEGDIGKIEPLGDHLRAEQDFGLAGAKTGQGSLVAAGLLHRVAVHPDEG